MKPTFPNKQSVLVPVRLGNNNVITFDYNDKQTILAYSPKKAHIINFVPVRLGNINSDITLNHNINRPSWATSSYKLPNAHYKSHHVAKVDNCPRVFVGRSLHFNSCALGRNVWNACRIATVGKLKGQNLSHALKRKKKFTQSCFTLPWKHVEEGVVVPRVHSFFGDYKIR